MNAVIPLLREMRNTLHAERSIARMQCSARTVALITLILRGHSLFADELPATVQLEPIVVTGTRLPQRLDELPAALSIVGGAALHQGSDIGVEEPLARVPGVFAQSSGNFAQDTRLQMRGFGARSGFGVREVKVLLDGLPLTFADGQTELDEVDVSAIDQIEVLRGAAAALYGNASGGVIGFFTPAANAPALQSRTVGGSFGLAKTHLSGTLGGERARGFLSASFLRVDGYRDHSEARRINLLGTSAIEVTPDTTLRFLFTGVDTLEAQDPGGLTADEVRQDRRQARPGALRFDTGEEVLQGRLGSVLEHRTSRGALTGYGYAVYRDVDSRLPIDPMQASPAQGGIISVHRVAAGGGLAASTRMAWLIPSHRLNGGVDVQYQRDARQRFANENGSRGARGLDQIEEALSVGPYLRYAALLTETVEVSAGVRYDNFVFSLDDTDAMTDQRTLSSWSPGGGVRYSPRPWLTAFADVGTAFQVPTTTELADPAGSGFNQDLEPQTATSTEAGVRVSRAGFSAAATGFIIDVRQVLVPFEIDTQPGRTFYRNASRAQRAGFELEAEGNLLPQLVATSAFTFVDARFVDNADGPDCCDGQHEPGIPAARLYAELAYRPERGFGAAVQAQWTDDIYVNDANTAKSPEAVVCDIRLTYRHTWQAWTLLAGVGLNNILSDRYDGRVRINAQGGRYFEPAARFNAYGSLEIAWSS